MIDRKIFVNSFYICNYRKPLFFLFFFINKTHFELNGCANEQNIHYWLANNPNWQITKSPHSEQVSVICHFTVPHHLWPFFPKDKNRRPLVLIPWNIKSQWKLFFGIEEMLNCPKVNLISIGQGHSTHYQRDHWMFKTKIWFLSHCTTCCILVATSKPDLTWRDFFFLGHERANTFLTPFPNCVLLKNRIQVETSKIRKEILQKVDKNALACFQICTGNDGHHSLTLFSNKIYIT